MPWNIPRVTCTFLLYTRVLVGCSTVYQEKVFYDCFVPGQFWRWDYLSGFLFKTLSVWVASVWINGSKYNIVNDKILSVEANTQIKHKILIELLLLGFLNGWMFVSGRTQMTEVANWSSMTHNYDDGYSYLTVSPILYKMTTRMLKKYNRNKIPGLPSNCPRFTRSRNTSWRKGSWRGRRV